MKVFSIVNIVLVIVFVVLASRALVSGGFIPTHDGEYHLIRVHEFSTALREGFLFPRWAPGLNSGYGVPLFSYFYPLPNYIGSFFHILGFSLVWSYKMSLLVGYLGSCICCYYWIRKEFHSSSIALMSAGVFGAIPYWFVELYVRGSIGEVLAICAYMGALMMLSLKRPIGFAFAISLGILGHNGISLIFLPFIVGYMLIRHRWAVTPFFLGIGVSSFFWIPALFEQSYVVGLNTVNYTDHFPSLYQLLIPSWGTGFSVAQFSYDEMSFQLGGITLVVIAMSVWRVLRERFHTSNVVLYMISVLVIAIVLMNQGSIIVWNLVTPLQLLQYPWRLLSIVFPIISYLFAYVVHRGNYKWRAISVVVLGMCFALPYINPVTYQERSDEYFLSRREFTDGTSSLANGFSAKWGPWQKERAGAAFELIDGNAYVEHDNVSSLEHTFTVQAQEESLLGVNIAYFPSWKALIDTLEVPIHISSTGAMMVTVPKGNHTVQIIFVSTVVQRVAQILSLISAFSIVFFFTFWNNIRKQPLKPYHGL